MVSPGSKNPARQEYMPFGKRAWRPSRQASPSTASMITTGSVRGKCCALQASHSRRQPAAETRVGAPQLAQWPCLACQCSRALAAPSWATICGAARPKVATRRKSTSSRSGRPGTANSRSSKMPSLAPPRCSTASSATRAAKTGAPLASIPSRAESRTAPIFAGSANAKRGSSPPPARRNIGMSRQIARLVASGRARNSAR